jgi:Cell division protein
MRVEPPATDEPVPAPAPAAARPRARRHALLAAAAVLAVAAGTAGTAALVRSAAPRSTAATPAETPANGTAQATPTEKTMYDLIVFLCRKGSDWPSCKGKAVTAAQREAVRRWLHDRSEVQRVQFVDRQAGYEAFKKQLAHNEALVAATRPEDMSESFEVYLEPGADRDAVLKAVEALPGVEAVYPSWPF